MTPRQTLHNKRLETAYRELCRAADAGEVGPTNIELSALCGYQEGDCGAGASNLLQTLVRQRRIRILPAATHGRRRLVEIVATGACTANPTARTNSIKREAKITKAEPPKAASTGKTAPSVPVSFNDPKLLRVLEGRNG